MKKLIVLVILSTSVLGCVGASSPDAADGAELLGVAASHRIFDDNTFGGQDVFERVEVVEVLGSWNASDVRIEFDDESAQLTSSQRAGIVESLASKEVEFVVVGASRVGESATEVARLSFTMPTGSNNDATVATELACGADCGAGGEQRFVADDDAGWRFAENVGEQWIS